MSEYIIDKRYKAYLWVNIFDNLRYSNLYIFRYH